jgi:PTH1 family peptidyl-tRNA hydrolase
MIVGLGNPGSKYAATRHNLGFMTVEAITRRYPPQTERRRFEAVIREMTIGQRRVALACPQTMMNNSGYAVSQAMRWYRLAPTDILVIYDELDLPFGRIRIRPGGGPGGHNGVRSIIDQLGTNEFARLRIGIGRPTSGSTVSYVLSRFRREEEERVPEIVQLAADAAICWATDGLDAAMNQFNRREARFEEPAVRGSGEGLE